MRSSQYSEWANQRVLTLLRERAVANPRVLALLAHIVAAEQVWLARLNGQESTALEIWPVLSLDGCASLVVENRAGYRDYFAALRAENLASEITYRNSKGVEFRSRSEDILTHLTVHGSYHRGQIARELRELGFRTVNTDFIAFSREGL